MPVLAPLILCATLGLAACASAPAARLSDNAPTAPDVDQRLDDARLVLRSLSSHPLASEVRDDLKLASTWLDRAETLAAVATPDPIRIGRFLDAAEGQLVMLKVYFSRRAGEHATGVDQAPLTEP